SDAALPKDGDDAREARVGVELESQARAVDEDEFACHPNVEFSLTADDFLCLAQYLVDRLLHHRVIRWIQLDGAQRAVRREEQIAPDLAEIPVVAALAHLLRGRRLCRRHRGDGHASPSRSARLMALRTRGSLSPAARRSASSALSLAMRPSAMAAQARMSGSTLRRSSEPRALSSASSASTPASPARSAYASNRAIFSVRSAARAVVPRTTLSTLGSALRCPAWPTARTAMTRISRSSSSSAFSRRRMAPGDPIPASAAAAACRASSVPD